MGAVERVVRWLERSVADAGWVRAVAVVALVTALGLAIGLQSRFWGFVQDDAYISLRYARNLLEGHGVVFNPGEPVEGYTNFLWMLVGAAALRARLDAVTALCVTGALAGLALLPLSGILLRTLRGGESRPGWDVLPPLLLASSTTLALWAVSGLEGTFFALLGWLGLVCALTRRPMAAAALFAAAMLTRPEGVLFPAATVLWLLLEARGVARERRGDLLRPWLGPALLLAATMAVYHGWRLWYFGWPFPNTYYVKGGGGWTNVVYGWSNFERLWAFNGNGVLISLTPLALIPARGRRAVAALLVFLAVYLLYEIKIGGDILPMYRLHLTVLPLQAVLAVRGLEALAHGARRVVRDEFLPWTTLLTPALVLLALMPTWWSALVESLSHDEYRGVRASLEGAHGAIGRYLEKRARPGDIAVGQDMGAMPWYAPSVVFLDAIGLVDATVAHEQYDEAYTPYIRHLLWSDDEARERIRAMERRLRTYMFGRNPRWFVVNVDVPSDRADGAAEALRQRHDAFFRPYVEANVFFADLGAADEWADYRLVKGWAYSTVHMMLVYERGDES